LHNTFLRHFRPEVSPVSPARVVMQRLALALSALILCVAVSSEVSAVPVSELEPSVRRRVVCPALFIGVCCKLSKPERKSFLTVPNPCYCSEWLGEVVPDNMCSQRKCNCSRRNERTCCLVDGIVMPVLNDCACACNGGTTPYAGCAPFSPSF
jgi:hypothetical protein